MHKVLSFLIIFVFINFSLARAEEVGLTLDEALALSLRNNRDILLKAQDIEKAKAKIAEAQAELFPRLNFTGSKTYTRGLYAKDLPQTTTQATLKQYLYQGGKTINTIQQNEYKLAVSQALLDKTKSDTVLEVKKTFFALFLAGELSGLNKGILSNTQAHLNFIEARYKNGEASESDLLKIKESLTDIEEVYHSSLNQVGSAASLLKNLLYLDDNITIKPEIKFSYEPMDIAYDEAFLKAMQKRPEIRQYEAQKQADLEAIEVVKADTRPSIYASWDYYSRSTTSLTFSPGKGWQDYNIVTLNFSWPIFDGWEAKHKVEQAIIDLKQTQLNKEKLIKDIALELKNAYLDFKNALYALKTAAAQILRYQDHFNVTNERYKNGLSSSLDLDDSGLSFKVAQFNHTQAIYDYLLLSAKFYRATGE